MTKSRTALCLLLAASSPGAALAAPIAIPGIIAAPPDPLTDAARLAALRTGMDCDTGRTGDEVVVCGRRGRGGGWRVPDEPEPGARVRLTAGEAPSARDALAAGGCLRLCYQPVMIDVISAVRAISRGVDRLLHPD